MNIKIFKGFENVYPERVGEIDSQYYAQWAPCSEAYEVPDFENEYPGTWMLDASVWEMMK